MKTLIKNYLILLFSVNTIIALPAYSQKKAELVKSMWPIKPILIDGRLDDWSDSLSLYNEATKLYYNLANDDENIYLAIKNSAPESLLRILARGISFSANIEPKKIPAMVTFPLLDRTPGKKHVETERPEPEEIQKRILERIKEIRVDGFKEIIDGGISLYNTYGIKAAAAFDSKNNLVQEIAIPIRLLGIDPDRKEPITYGIRINGFQGPAAVQQREMNAFDDMYGGGFGGRFNGRYGGMYGGMPNRNFAPVRISTSTEFFIKSSLAEPL
ncbi:MAG: hypothetical protein FJY21_05045 [Bacteroidetes bacterium]|nr:hypothetical protein [Bacteroidota bacterium]